MAESKEVAPIADAELREMLERAEIVAPGAWVPSDQAMRLRQSLGRDLPRVVQRLRYVEAENGRLRVDLTSAQAVCDSLAHRVAAQSELLSQKASRRSADDVEAENAKLTARVRDLEAVIQPFAEYANTVRQGWPDNTGPSLLFLQPDGSMEHKPRVSLGDCRRAAEALQRKDRS